MNDLAAELYLANQDKVDYPAFTQNLQDYASLFRNFGVDLIQLIKNRNDSPQLVIDAGCGDASALVDIQQIVDTNSKLYGITAHQIKGRHPGIHIVTGDANLSFPIFHNIRSNHPELPSIILSVYLARYLANPFSFLEDIYNNMHEGDIALLYELPLPLISHKGEIDEFGIQVITRYLHRYGITIIRGSGIFYNAVIIERHNSNMHLTIPVRPECFIQGSKRIAFSLRSQKHDSD